MLDHFLLFHALIPKMIATMTEIEGRITPIMIWSSTLRPPLPLLLLLLPAEGLPLGLLEEDVEGTDGGGEGMDGDVEGADGDVEGEDEDVKSMDEGVEGVDALEENGEEDESLEIVLHSSMLYWLTEELL